jgi:hypothetical protein
VISVDTTRWRFLGESSNTRYFEIETEVLGALPNPGSTDDGETARENLSFQHDHWRKHGPGVVVVFFDNMVSQDKDARRVYQQESDPALMRGTALVGGTLLGRAMGSFFLGLSKPAIPLKMFGDLEQALAWARDLNKKSEGSTKEG